MEEWNIGLPKPASEDWRKAYGFSREGRSYRTSDSPAKTSYQAPGGKPVNFVYKCMRLTGGLSVDTAEYPFFGMWSSKALNEKPHCVTVSGFLRGDEYIKTRNALVDALAHPTSDDEPGYISLPLWGRIPVVVVDWEVAEDAAELGQCKIDITFTRAGVPIEQRWEAAGAIGKTLEEAAEELKIAAVASYEKKLTGFLDERTLIKSFSLIKIALINVVGRVQASERMLNAITNEVSGITNLLAQGTHSPKSLALALFSAIAKIAGSLAEIKNAGEESVASFRIKNNEKNALFCFFPQHKYRLPVEAVTAKQVATKKETENLYKTAALYAAARILPEMPVQSYNRTANLFALYDRLEKAVDVNEPELYFAVSELRSALARTLAAKQLSEELSIQLNASMPLLALAHYLGSREAVLRNLNRIEDSFVVNMETHYV